MDVIGLPLLPTSIWVLAAAITILILLVVFGFFAYHRKRLDAALDDASHVAELAAQIDLLEARKKVIIDWISQQNDELQRLTAERQEQQIIRAELQRLEQECTVKDQENQSLRNEVGELENQRHLLSQTMDRIGKEVEDLEKKKKAFGDLEKQFTDLKPKFDGMSQELAEKRRQVEESLQAMIQTKIELDTLRAEKAPLESKIEDLKKVREAAQQREDLYHLETEQAKQEAHKAQKEADKTERALSGKQEEVAQSQIRIDALRHERDALEKEINQKSGELGAGTQGQDDLEPYEDLLDITPSWGSFSKGPPAKIDEAQALLNLQDRFRDDNLVFSPRVIDAFHTSLKCHEVNPLTVLAGVSGTGKTLLPVYYAKMMGMYSLIMAVQPRWDSPQDMFGFYNYLEKKYKATDLSRAIIRMDPYNYNDKKFSKLDANRAREGMLLILLDEMNLARTEYYFSEFLSKLELRRLVTNPKLKADRELAEIELDTGPGKSTQFRIWVGHNVLFVGTMNEDETTQTLSDKVLDRANVLRFGKPDENIRPAGEILINVWPDEYLPADQWKLWIQPGNRIDQNNKWYARVDGWISRLNNALNEIGRPFGHRVRMAILMYVANYPEVNDRDRFQLAFADQVEQKIIPKLRGLDLGEETTSRCMDELEEIIDELGDGELGEALEQSRTNSVGMFQWRGVTRRVQGNP